MLIMSALMLMSALSASSPALLAAFKLHIPTSFSLSSEDGVMEYLGTDVPIIKGCVSPFIPTVVRLRDLHVSLAAFPLP